MRKNTDRGAPYGAEIGGEPSPLLPDPDHAGVGSRHTEIAKIIPAAVLLGIAAYFFRLKRIDKSE